MLKPETYPHCNSVVYLHIYILERAGWLSGNIENLLALLCRCDAVNIKQAKSQVSLRMLAYMHLR